MRRGPHDEGIRLLSCCLCQRPATWTGVFYPFDDFARRIAYALCDRCRKLPNRDQRVERQLLQDLP
jgi:hypothetical protein